MPAVTTAAEMLTYAAEREAVRLNDRHMFAEGPSLMKLAQSKGEVTVDISHKAGQDLLARLRPSQFL